MDFPKIRVKTLDAKLQGYSGHKVAQSSVRRALRWLKAPRNQGMKPPHHIQEKMKLIEVLQNG